ncbi:MAG: RNA polymerase sigma factor [Acutalibacter sp.]
MTDLVKRSKTGDKEAFALLMDQHRQLLYNTALLTLHQEDDALDAIQDTILACWESLPTLRKDRYFKTWLVKILLNKCRDIQRKQSRYALVEELPEAGNEPDWDTSMDVDAALSQLSSQDQLILSLYYYDDLTVRQIADALSISEGAVRVRLTRSRDRFKRLYLQEKGECT